MLITESPFWELIQEAERLCLGCEESEEIVVLKTAGGKLYHCRNRGILTGECDWSGETALFEQLRSSGDTQVTYFLCWIDVKERENPDIYPLEMGSWHLREGLLALDRRNLDAYLLMVGEYHYNARRLGDCLPPKKDFGLPQTESF